MQSTHAVIATLSFSMNSFLIATSSFCHMNKGACIAGFESRFATNDEGLEGQLEEPFANNSAVVPWIPWVWFALDCSDVDMKFAACDHLSTTLSNLDRPNKFPSIPKVLSSAIQSDPSHFKTGNQIQNKTITNQNIRWWLFEHNKTAHRLLWYHFLVPNFC